MCACHCFQECNRRPLVPIRSVPPHSIERALFDFEAETSAKLKNTGKLQLLIVILPEVSGSYGKLIPAGV